MFDLTGQTAVITGGGRGIGRGIAIAMTEAGARVAIAGRNEDALLRVRAEVEKAGGEALAIVTDVTKPDQVDRLITQAAAKFGYIGCWVNNAGSALPADALPLLELAPAQWERVVGLNLTATFFCCQAAARQMTTGGSIINISSRSGSFPNPRTGHYGAAKAGVDNLTATMALEWGHLGIRVNAIAPGLVLTETNQSPGGSLSTPGRRERQLETIPLRRLGEVDDVGSLAVFLASEGASWLTGQVIQLNGGSRIPVGYLSYLRQVNAASTAAASREG